MSETTTQTEAQTTNNDDENTKTEEEERIEFLENEIDRLEDDIAHVEGGIENANKAMTEVQKVGLNTWGGDNSQVYDRNAESVDRHGMTVERELDEFKNAAEELVDEMRDAKAEMEDELEDLQTETLTVDIGKLGNMLHERFNPENKKYNVDVQTAYAVRDGSEIELTRNPSEDAERLGTAAGLITTSPTAPSQILDEYPEVDTEAVYQSYRDDIKAGLVDEIQGYEVETLR